MNSWKIYVFNMIMIRVLKKKIEYFHYPWTKILLHLFSSYCRCILNNLTIKKISFVTFKLKGSIGIKNVHKSKIIFKFIHLIKKREHERMKRDKQNFNKRFFS